MKSFLFFQIDDTGLSKTPEFCLGTTEKGKQGRHVLRLYENGHYRTSTPSIRELKVGATFPVNS